MKYFFVAIAALILVNSCTKDSSPTTGWDYNNPKNGGFQKVPFSEQETGPGLVLIEGGTFTLYLEQDSIITDQTMEVVVPSYYLDEKEVTNESYLEYLYWTRRTFGYDFPLVHASALPDTLVWEGEIGSAGNYIKNYLRHPAYRNYPVVGVSWMQANNYCEWRTDRVNEYILIREGILYHNPSQMNEDNFNTEAYLAGQYHTGVASMLPDLDPMKAYGKGKNGLGERIVRMEDGILLPQYRLPTEVEWEYAASSGVTIDSKTQKKLDQKLMHLGQFVNPYYYNDVAFNTLMIAPVDAYLPNDFGIYNLSGNVSEWVADAYIERTDSTINSYSPFVGKNTRIPRESVHYKYDEKLNLVIYDLQMFDHFLGELKTIYLEENRNDSVAYEVFRTTEEHLEYAMQMEKEGHYLDAAQIMMTLSHDVFDEMQVRFNYYGPNGNEVDNQLLVDIKKYMAKSVLALPGQVQFEDVSPYDRIKYRNNNSANYPFYDSVITMNDLRVVKGANWADNEKWVEPSFRRKMNKFSSSPLVGFRCAMDRVGSPVGLSKKKKK